MKELVAIVTGASQGIGRATAVRLAKAFAEQGIKDGIQVNSVVPGAVMTHRRKSFMEKWAPKSLARCELIFVFQRRR
jgi:NAD(P)-dependent dehydrogenase (short-subunit alcohol dehydrogenase family)